MAIETFNEILAADVELEFEFAVDSAFVLINNRSIHPVSVYLKDDSGYNATPVTILAGRSLPLPIVTDAVKLKSETGGPVSVVCVPSINYGQVGASGADGEDAFVYIAYASDDAGTGFTQVFNPSLDYIAIITTTTAIETPSAEDFAGLWKNIKGQSGADGDDGASSFCYVAYASDDTGTGFTTTFNPSLDFIAVKTSTTPLVPDAGDFAGLWKNYKGATGATGATGADGADGADGNDGADGEDGANGPIAVTILIDGQGEPLTTNQILDYIYFPYAWTITGWEVNSPDTGSIEIEIRKCTTANYPPDGDDVISGTEHPFLDAESRNELTTLTDWSTVAVAVGDYLGYRIIVADGVLTKVKITFFGVRA